MTVWDKRYAVETYVYGTEPNDYLRDQAKLLDGTKVLCLGDGEGRNSVWLAEQGFDVTSVDISVVGLEKGRALAKKRQVDVSFEQADLYTYVLGSNHWDAVVSIFVPMQFDLRVSLHNKVKEGLVSGGIYLFESYHPDQADRSTGGGSDPSAMLTAAELMDDFSNERFLHLEEKIRDVREGTFHTGEGAVVQATIQMI